MIDDAWGGGSSSIKIKNHQIKKRNALYNAITTRGGIITKLSDYVNTVFDKGVLITFDDEHWIERRLGNKFKKAGDIRWVLGIDANLQEVENFIPFAEKQITLGRNTVQIQVFKRIKVNI